MRNPQSAERVEPFHDAPKAERAGCEQAGPQVAIVEIDRYCEHCGYNLRTRPVERDERLEVLVVRCPECGRWAPGADATTIGWLWTQRLSHLMLVFYLLALLVGVVVATVCMTVSMNVLIELQTQYTARGELEPGLQNLPGRGGLVLMPHALDAEELAWVVLTSVVAFMLGGLLVSLATVLVHHWPRSGYVALAVLFPLAPAILTWVGWQFSAAHLRGWLAIQLGWSAALCVAGGLVAVMVGRPLARLLLKIFLPPRWRGPFPFLWLADGLAPPKTVT